MVPEKPGCCPLPLSWIRSFVRSVLWITTLRGEEFQATRKQLGWNYGEFEVQNSNFFNVFFKFRKAIHVSSLIKFRQFCVRCQTRCMTPSGSMPRLALRSKRPGTRCSRPGRAQAAPPSMFKGPSSDCSDHCQEYQEKEPELAAQFKRAVMDRKLPENWADCLPKVGL